MGQRHDRVQTESQQLQPWTAVGFQVGLYHVVAPLSFLGGISLASFCYSFYFWLIRSFTDPTQTGSIFVSGHLHHYVKLFLRFSLADFKIKVYVASKT